MKLYLIDKKGWFVQETQRATDLASILSFLIKEYSRIFGEHILCNKECIVYNDPSSECPMFILNTPLKIRLSQDSLGCWAQTIFQLSHELMHYVMHQSKKDKSFTLSWFEEIVCEAMSLYALDYASTNWQYCALERYNPTYSRSISEYLTNQINKPHSLLFHECDTLEKLRKYEDERISEDDRSTHRFERNMLYNAIKSNPENAICFLNYTEYLDEKKSNLILDLTKWYSAYSCEIVKAFYNIQPVQ